MSSQHNPLHGAIKGYVNGAMDCYVTFIVRNWGVTHVRSRVAKDLAVLDSYVSSASDVDSAAALQQYRTKRTRQLHQRGDGTLRNSLGSKLRVIYRIGGVGRDLAGLDGHVSVVDVNPAALKHTNNLRQWGDVCGYQNRQLQRGDGRMFEKVQKSVGTHSACYVIVNAA